MTARRTSIPAVLVVFAFAACADNGADQEQTPAAGVGAEEKSAEGMAGMEGMQHGEDTAMSQMMSHIQMMRGMSADSMRGMMPAHRQMVANMVAQMNREMREMNMTTDAEWNAVVDSLRQDLARMPEMSGSEFQAMMPGHHERMVRLMEMHRKMLARMKM